MTTSERKALRREVGSQEAVADLLGVTARTVSRFETEESYHYATVFEHALRALLFDRKAAEMRLFLSRFDTPPNEG